MCSAESDSSHMGTFSSVMPNCGLFGPHDITVILVGIGLISQRRGIVSLINNFKKITFHLHSAVNITASLIPVTGGKYNLISSSVKTMKVINKTYA